MSVIETTIFECGAYNITVTGSRIHLIQRSNGTILLHSIDRATARDLSKAFSLAADIVRSPRKRKPKQSELMRTAEAFSIANGDPQPAVRGLNVSDLDPNEH